MAQGRYLTVVEADSVTQQIADAGLEDGRVEEVFDALKFRISVQPDCGDLVQHEGLEYRLVVTAPLKLAKNKIVLARYRTYVEGESLLIDWVKIYPYDEALAYTPPAFDLDA